jgi:hypothetical protein
MLDLTLGSQLASWAGSNNILTALQSYLFCPLSNGPRATGQGYLVACFPCHSLAADMPDYLSLCSWAESVLTVLLQPSLPPPLCLDL